MKAAVDICCENGIWAELRIVNDSYAAARIHNPGDDWPLQGWAFSREAYRIAVLRSFHFLEMTLHAKDGIVAERADIATLVDHEVGLPVELESGADLVISIPLHEFYDLKRDADYSLALTYGDDTCRVSAAAQVRCS